MFPLRSPLVVALLVLIAASSRADNWPHWRGEGGNGVSTTATPPTEWSDTQNVKWKAELPGRGSGSPIVWEDRVFVVTSVPSQSGEGGALDFIVICFDRETGKIEWQRTVATGTPHEGTHITNNFASASPTTDGQHVYAHFGSQGLYCLTMDGEPVWDRDFGDMKTRNEFGEGSSPTIAGEKIIVPWDHEGQSYIYALNKLDGDILWQVERDEPTNWATPLVVTHGGRQQVVMNGQNYACSYDLDTGDELWRCDGQTERPAASAVAMGDMVFVTSGFRGSFLGAFDLGGRGDIKGTPSVLWTKGRDTPDIASPLLSAGRLYYYKAKTGILTCVDAATGVPHYASQRTALQTTYASPVAAGGHVYLSDRDGTTVVIKDANQYQVVATNRIGETIDATPAPVDNQLFIRGERNLFCIEE